MRLKKNTLKEIKLYLASLTLVLLTLGIFVFSTRNNKSINPKTSKATLVGDANNDAKVDILDFQLLSNTFGKVPGQTGYDGRCDFNSSNTVDILDFQLLSNNFGAVITVSISPTVRPSVTAQVTVPPLPTGVGDPVVMANADIICTAMGSATSTACNHQAVSQLVVDTRPQVFLAVGDLCHDPTNACYSDFYGPSYGRVKSITRPITGNHEYLTANAFTFFDYFNGIGVYSGIAGDRDKGYYSFNVGTWHIIALNTQCSEVGGCGTSSPQYTWLENDLKTYSNKCTLAYYHIPLFSSGGRANTNSKDLYTLLYNYNAELVLDGHDHIYERFAPQNPNGSADSARGIREIIVGTGGANHTSIVSVAANSEVRNADTFGVLKLTLHPLSYNWQFVPVAGKTFTDSGSANCH